MPYTSYLPSKPTLYDATCSSLSELRPRCRVRLRVPPQRGEPLRVCLWSRRVAMQRTTRYSTIVRPSSLGSQNRSASGELLPLDADGFAENGLVIYAQCIWTKSLYYYAVRWHYRTSVTSHVEHSLISLLGHRSFYLMIELRGFPGTVTVI
jgi:hypothetical protein